MSGFVMISWLRSLALLSKKANGARLPAEDEPPPLPYRCGTMLMRAGADTRRRMNQAWDDDEHAFIDWVHAHPNPKPEWVEQVERLIRGRAFVEQLRSADSDNSDRR